MILFSCHRKFRGNLWKEQTVLWWEEEVSEHWNHHCAELRLPRASQGLTHHFCTWSWAQLRLSCKYYISKSSLCLWLGCISVDYVISCYVWNLFVFFTVLVLQHDSGIECTPGESKLQDKKERGNYIMYARATSGDKLNNNKFSMCSIRNISAVLMKKRDDCFVGTFSFSHLFSSVCERFFMPLCLYVQSLASLSVAMD